MPQQAPSSDDKPANPRRIAVVTTGRADYGILSPVLRALDARPDTAPVICATGAHLSQRLGRTIDTIRADGWCEIQEIPSEADDRDLPTAAKIARATAGFVDAFTDHRPDLCLLLGDRFETLAAATAAAASGVPIAHIHGGEVTLGALDNQFRYAITALANLHCTATELSRRRLIAMGEPDHTVIHTEANFRERVMDLTGGRGADAVFETVGGDSFMQSLRCMAPGSRICVIGFAGGMVPQIPANHLLVKNITVCGLFLGYYCGWGREDVRYDHRDHLAADVERLTGWWREGKLSLHTSHVLPLEDFQEAMRIVTSREAMGRVVVVP